MKNIILISLLLLGLIIDGYSQNDCPIITPPVNDNCGNAPLVSYEANGDANFCENSLVELVNTTDGDVGYYDYFIINWGDESTLDTVYDYNNINHIFDFGDIDRCELNANFPTTFCYVGVLECDDGITNSSQIGFLSIKLRPVAQFEFDPMVCIDTPVTMTSTGCNADLYFWDVGNDGTIESTSSQLDYTFEDPGVYIVKLKVENSECEVSDETTQTITVVDFPTAEIVAETNGGEGCNPSRQIISIDANEWVLSQPSGYFNWSISGSDGWCFTNDTQQQNPCPQDPANNFCPCIPDSLLSNQIIDSLLQLPTLDIWFDKAGDYTVELDYGNVCDDITIQETITIYEPPSIEDFGNINACDELVLCYEDMDISFNGEIDSYSWVFTGGSIPSFSGTDPDFGCVTFTSSGSITVSATAFDPCEDVTETVEVGIIETDVVNVSDPSPNTICQNDEPIFLDPEPSNGEYYLNGSLVDFIVNDTLYPALTDGGTFTIDYILNAECDAQDQFGFTIIESPKITLDDNPAECESITDFNPNIDEIEGDIDAYVWSLCDTMGVELLTSTEVDPSFDYSESGTFVIKVELISNECGSVFDSSSVVIVPNDPATIDPFDNPYCPGVDPIILTATPSGGTWSGVGIIDVNTGLFDPSILTTSTTAITYTIDGEVCGSSDMQTIEVILNDLSLPPPSSICYYDGEYTLGATNPMGGIWTGDGIVDGVNGIIDITGFTTDSLYTYTYCVESDEIDCESCRNTTLYIEPNPTAEFSIMGSPCAGYEFMLINESIETIHSERMLPSFGSSVV